MESASDEFRIELEPVGDDVVVPGDPAPPAPDWSAVLTGDSGRPLPNRPGHHCPSCDYDLRGIAGRTCPECGEHFTISEARNAGLSRDPRSRTDYQVIQRQRLLLPACAGLFVLAYFSPFILTWTAPTLGALFIQTLLAFPFAFCGFSYSWSFARSAREGIVVATALYVGFSCVLAWMLW